MLTSGMSSSEGHIRWLGDKVREARYRVIQQEQEQKGDEEDMKLVGVRRGRIRC